MAVKEIWLPPAGSDELHRERVTRATREARNAAKLRDHPNIVAVHDAVVENGVPWTVMRLVDGCSLEEHLRAEGPLPAARVAKRPALYSRRWVRPTRWGSCIRM
ncbi:hypothetical protein ACPB9E_37265 [Streptomyces exfoliatus]|uniref:hypothetical protein n=1 Tax=Streptomyces exfoliatus TaxID=1905 RepID=UPI003C2FB744